MELHFKLCQEMWVTIKRDYNAWVTPPIILLRFTRITAWGTHILSQEEFTTFTHIVADNSLQGALKHRPVYTKYAADIRVAELKLAHSVKMK